MGVRDVMGYRVCRANRSAEQLVATTLRQVIGYIHQLPDAEQNSPEWQHARQCVFQAADQVGSIWFARIAIVQALQRHREKVI